MVIDAQSDPLVIIPTPLVAAPKSVVGRREVRLMRIRVSSSVLASVILLVLSTGASAQSLSDLTRPAFEPGATPFAAPVTATPNPGQIVDRSTDDLRPRFHWGVIGAFAPHWAVPAGTPPTSPGSTRSPDGEAAQTRVAIPPETRAGDDGSSSGGCAVIRIMFVVPPLSRAC
jgi:hypothetical protein